ncbi:MAG TPA: hypothetical protein VNI60_11505, partial [Pyrinomonadaceae bacterium]|nr:hypothetical protein [Pyrinomonadaceae bacterium]
LFSIGYPVICGGISVFYDASLSTLSITMEAKGRLEEVKVMYKRNAFLRFFFHYFQRFFQAIFRASVYAFLLTTNS